MDIVTRQQLNVLIQLAKVDKDFAKVEERLIHQIAEKYGFSRKEVQKMINDPEPIGSFGALSDFKKFEYLYNLVQLVLADNRIHPSETIFCQSLAIKMGYQKDVINGMLELMNTEHVPTMEELYEQTRKYQI
jgi:hypothetical protein